MLIKLNLDDFSRELKEIFKIKEKLWKLKNLNELVVYNLMNFNFLIC